MKAVQNLSFRVEDEAGLQAVYIKKGQHCRIVVTYQNYGTAIDGIYFVITLGFGTYNASEGSFTFAGNQYGTLHAMPTGGTGQTVEATIILGPLTEVGTWDGLVILKSEDTPGPVGGGPYFTSTKVTLDAITIYQ